MTVTFWGVARGVGIHSLFTGKMQNVGKEQSGQRVKQKGRECTGLPVLSGSAGSAGGGSDRLVGDTLPFLFFNWRWFLYFLDLT